MDNYNKKNMLYITTLFLCLYSTCYGFKRSTTLTGTVWICPSLSLHSATTRWQQGAFQQLVLPLTFAEEVSLLL